ncbi:MAG: YbhB/YbcL family Raf kinase inhibitor-like protein [Armatimonadia bacterium]
MMKAYLRLLSGLTVLGMLAGTMVLGGCRGGAPPASSTLPQTTVPKETKPVETMTSTTLKLTSTSLQDGMPIPVRYTADGKNLSPELAWQDVPEGVAELALIVEDPDAPSGDFVHWVVYSIPSSMNGLAEGLPTGHHPDAQVPFVQGRNDFGKVGYNGPAPPPGKVHHYHFRLMALDQKLNLPANADKKDLRQAVRGHIIAESELVGTYQR